MGDDPDLLKANYILQVLRQARLSTQQIAWVAISELAKALNEEGFAGPTLWKAALRATESWKRLLI